MLVMRLRTAWSAAAAANKATGKKDVDFDEHIEATEQGHLPQIDVIRECLTVLKEKDLVEEVCLRGSLGRGHGDIHSDIDFFTVVKPENIEKVYNEVNMFLERRGGLITDCHDRLVADYGGIGFMFVARNGKDQGRIYQFDLYMAMKGVAPAIKTTVEPRIFAKDPSYRWTDEFGKKRDMEALPQETKDFMKRHTSGNDVADRVELIAQELMLNVFVTSKHIKRGQTSRIVVDNNYLVSSCIEMLQAITGYKTTGYTSIYLGNEVVDFCRKNGDADLVEAAGKLEKFFTQTPDKQKLKDMLSYAAFVLEKGFPERFANQKKAFEAFEKEILQAKKKKPTPAMPKVG